MSLNTIELKEFLLADLYRDNLLDSPGFIANIPAAEPLQPPAQQAVPQTYQPSTPPQQPIELTRPAEPAEQPAPTRKTPSQQPAAQTQQPAQQAPQQPAPYKVLGNNRRNITIIVSSPGIAFLPDDQLAFLGKMLEACKMNMADVAIVNHAATPVRIQTLRQQLSPSNTLLFGVGPVEIGLPMDFPAFKIQPYDQCAYLCAPALGDMLVPGNDATILKKNLWASLKSLFGI